MEENGKTIFVPWDFNGVSEYALDHALFYSSHSQLEVCLVHIAKKESQIHDVKSRLDKIADDIYTERGKRIRTIVDVGSFHSGMEKAANENKAAMIFVGIDGFKGIKKYIGSNILNVLSGAVIPSVVVQKPKTKRAVFSIICPIDQRRESKTLLRWTAYLASFIEVKVYLAYPEFEEPEKNAKIFANVSFARHYLKEAKINFEIECFSIYDFNNSIVNFASKNKIDLILNLTKKETDYRSFFTTPRSHYLIANSEKIPVMCITPSRGMWRYVRFK